MTTGRGIELSLNEVETLAAKASRGAGLGWGQAEDLGRASRWLAARACVWAEPLVRLLGAETERSDLLQVLALADRCGEAPLPARWTVPACSLRWSVPAVAAAIHGRARTVDLRASGRTIRLGPDDEARSDAPLPDLAEAPPCRLAVEIRRPGDGAALIHRLMPATRRSMVSPGTRAALDALAARICVPSSATSRALGAGGAGLDGD